MPNKKREATEEPEDQPKVKKVAKPRSRASKNDESDEQPRAKKVAKSRSRAPKDDQQEERMKAMEARIEELCAEVAILKNKVRKMGPTTFSLRT